MVKKSLKAGLSIILALSIAVFPNTAAYAKTIAAQPQTQSTSDKDQNDTFSATRKLAEAKAASITSFYGATSVQYALIDNGKITLSGVAGIYSKNAPTPLTDTKMYGIGSVSKVFTTAAVLQLVDEGLVNLDTPVVNYIPEFTMADPRYKDITVRMLLNHSSGLMGSTLGSSMLFGDKDTTTYDNLLNTLKTSRLKADPGEFSVYCNDGFTLAELLVEKVTGSSFTDYLRNHISNPLDLYNTKTPQDSFQTDRLVKIYLPGSKEELPSDTVNAIGAGGIYSSAKNLCEFATIFMDNSTSSVLSKASAKAMQNKEYLRGFWSDDKPAPFTYGLGWDSVNTYPFEDYGIKALSKSGDTLFYHGNLMVLPQENMAVAVLTSGGNSSANLVMAQEILLSALKEKGVIQEIHPDKTFTKPVNAPMPQELKQYAGYYGNFTSTSKITISDDGILTSIDTTTPNADSQKLIYTGDGRFYYTDGSAYISFKQAPNGNTYLYLSGYSNLPGLGQAVTDEYRSQKLAPNPVSEEVNAAWDKRAGKKYFVLNERFSSETYVISPPFTELPAANGLVGYFASNTIVDANTAKANLKIPSMYGRDLNDYTFYKEGNTEYIKAESAVLISEDGVSNLPGSSFTVDINGSGYAHWYKIGKETGNKKIKVKLPKKAAFFVYTKDGTCVSDSYVSKQDTVTLPQEGYIVFAGEVNTHFVVSYVKK
jgi:CubicO group peptidase (beta-lactamase class C family)